MAEITSEKRGDESLRRMGGSRWRKIQDLFAKVIGINIALLDSDASIISKSQVISPDINDIVVPLDGSILKSPPAFIINAIRAGSLTGKNELSRYGLHYFLIEVPLESFRRGFFVIGPVLVGRKETVDRLTAMCEEEKIHAEIYLDQVEELKRYSYVGISAILEFLSEITEWSISFLQSDQESGDQGCTHSRGWESLLSLRYGHELANALLEIALSLVEGASGSVLLYDPSRDCFEIQAARGLQGEVIRDTVISSTDSVSGVVASRGKPMLLHHEIADEDIRKRLQKPSIKSSILIPMQHHEKMIGLLCVNTQEENSNFNQENLLLLSQLGRIASIAFARISDA